MSFTTVMVSDTKQTRQLSIQQIGEEKENEKRRKREEDDDAKNVVERESRVRRLFVFVRAVFTIETRASAVRYAFSECSYECEWFCQR